MRKPHLILTIALGLALIVGVSIAVSSGPEPPKPKPPTLTQAQFDQIVEDEPFVVVKSLFPAVRSIKKDQTVVHAAEGGRYVIYWGCPDGSFEEGKCDVDWRVTNKAHYAGAR